MADHDLHRMEWTLAEMGNQFRERPASDPTSAGVSRNGSLKSGPEVLFGRVVDSIPYVNTYKVLPERGLSVITCGYATPGPCGIIGAKSVSTLPVGAMVWFIFHRSTNHGMIIAVAPDYMSDGAKALSDFIYVGSRSGLHVDPANSYPFQTAARGIIDFSSGRPFDSTSGGEWGAITETGLRVLLDSFMVQLGCGEACGVYAYYWDQLLRLAGVNLQIRSSFSEQELLDDQSETYGMHGISIYPWEALGLPRFGNKAGRVLDAQQTELDESWYAANEPQHDDQAPIRRVKEFSGYLGQGGRRTISIPISRVLNTYGEPITEAAVFEEQISLTGRYTLRSATGVTIAKRPLIPAVRQKARPEAGSGDTPQNYRFSGLDGLGQGPEHKIHGAPGLPEMTSGTDPGRVRARGIEDLHAYVFNWANQTPFHYHQNDWTVSEETQSPLGTQLPEIDFGTLSENSQMYLQDPPRVNLDVDHRYNTVAFALSSSYFTLLDDGGVAIGDGFGSEILMSGGSIELSAPGDVWLKSGRNAVVWGGRDVVVRGRNHVDITASKKDVRIKAEKHLWALAGNGGSDGMLLLESRATSTYFDFGKDTPIIGEAASAGGVVLRATNNAVMTWSKDLYLRTGGGSIQAGDVFIDAGKGKSNILTTSQSIVNYLDQDGWRIDAYLTPRNVAKLHAYGQNSVFLSSNVYALGALAVDGEIYANSWIYVDNGSIASSEADATFGRVQSISAGDLASFFQEVRKAGDDAKPNLYTLWQTDFDQKWYQEHQAGADDTLAKAEFSCRSADQYRTYTSGGANFRIYEDRWQQMARKSGSVSTVWQEPVVSSQGVNTMPWPGYESFTQSGGLVLVPTTMFDMDRGTAKPRGAADSQNSPYHDPKYGTPEKAVLNDSYLVTG